MLGLGRAKSSWYLPGTPELCRGSWPRCRLHNTQAPLGHEEESWGWAELQQSCPVWFCAV